MRWPASYRLASAARTQGRGRTEYQRATADEADAFGRERSLPEAIVSSVDVKLGGFPEKCRAAPTVPRECPIASGIE